MTPIDLLNYLNSADDEGLYAQARAVEREAFGKKPVRHAVLHISNFCDHECRHCALRNANRELPRYRLSAAHALDMAAQAARDGASAVVLRSGHDRGCTTQLIAKLIREIKYRHGLAVILSLGQRDLDEYAYWRECGADRSQVNLETTEPFAFKRLRQEEHFTDRLHLLEELRGLGYSIGSGVVAGLPGSSPMDSVRDILFLADLGLDMIEIAPFVPRPGTPMSGMGPGSVDTAMRMAALLRIMLPEACIPAMAALDELRPGSSRLALERGCNAVQPSMPIPSPVEATYAEHDHVR